MAIPAGYKNRGNLSSSFPSFGGKGVGTPLRTASSDILPGLGSGAPRPDGRPRRPDRSRRVWWKPRDHFERDRPPVLVIPPASQRSSAVARQRAARHNERGTESGWRHGVDPRRNDQNERVLPQCAGRAALFEAIRGCLVEPQGPLWAARRQAEASSCGSAPRRTLTPCAQSEGAVGLARDHGKKGLQVAAQALLSCPAGGDPGAAGVPSRFIDRPGRCKSDASGDLHVPS